MQAQEEQEQDDGNPSLPPGYRWEKSTDKNGKKHYFILTPPDKNGKQRKIRKGYTQQLELLHKQKKCLELQPEHIGGKRKHTTASTATSITPAP